MTMFYSQKTVLWGGGEWAKYVTKLNFRYQVDQNKPGKSNTETEIFCKLMCIPGFL